MAWEVSVGACWYNLPGGRKHSSTSSTRPSAPSCAVPALQLRHTRQEAPVTARSPRTRHRPARPLPAQLPPPGRPGARHDPARPPRSPAQRSPRAPGGTTAAGRSQARPGGSPGAALGREPPPAQPRAAQQQQQPPAPRARGSSAAPRSIDPARPLGPAPLPARSRGEGGARRDEAEEEPGG